MVRNCCHQPPTAELIHGPAPLFGPRRYIKSEKRIKNETKMLFEKFDENKSGGIDFHEVGKLLRNLGNTITDPEIEEAVKEMGVDPQSNEVTKTNKLPGLVGLR